MVEFVQGSNKFYIRPIPPFEAITLLGNIQKLIGPSIGKVIAAIFSGEKAEGQSLLNRKIDGNMIAGAFQELAQYVDGPKLQTITRDILNPQYISVSIGGREAIRLEEGTANEVFTGNIGGIFLLIGKVLEVTYGDFFGKVASLTGSVINTGKQ